MAEEAGRLTDIEWMPPVNQSARVKKNERITCAASEAMAR